MKKFICLTLVLFCAAGYAAVDQSNVGKKLPPLSVNYISNAPVSTTGKPMIVEFWATWCPPCRQSIPHLNEIYKTYKDRGLVVIGISNEDRSKVSEFMKTLPMNYSVALDAGSAYSRQFGISGIPHAMLVNAAGNIVWEGHPMSMTPADIEKIMTPGAASATTGVSGTTPPPLPSGNKKYY